LQAEQRSTSHGMPKQDSSQDHLKQIEFAEEIMKKGNEQTPGNNSAFLQFLSN